ncbi:hypothetical protein [Kitasatospora sp. NPDC093102]|uniref:hypothetical protein n=1 Tax=Kitasatospora sp. NPDC093102 TaxID=3155069 RepID=UPI003447D8C2
MHDEGGPAGVRRVRDLVRAWSIEGWDESAEAGGTGFEVPPATAAEVIAVVRGLVARPGEDIEAVRFAVRRESGPGGFAQLRRIAEALVVAEHPSAESWTAAEWDLAADWVAVLIARQGEDGVERLTEALSGAGA